MCSIVIFTCDDHYQSRNCHVGTQSLHFLWWARHDKVRHNMTQIASVLAVATVFIGLWTPISTFDREGGLIGETKIPMWELEQKVWGPSMVIIHTFYDEYNKA